MATTKPRKRTLGCKDWKGRQRKFEVDPSIANTILLTDIDRGGVMLPDNPDFLDSLADLLKQHAEAIREKQFQETWVDFFAVNKGDDWYVYGLDVKGRKKRVEEARNEDQANSFVAQRKSRLKMAQP